MVVKTELEMAEKRVGKKVHLLGEKKADLLVREKVERKAGIMVW